MCTCVPDSYLVAEKLGRGKRGEKFSPLLWSSQDSNTRPWYVIYTYLYLHTSLAISRVSQTMLDPNTYDMAPRSSSSYPTYQTTRRVSYISNIVSKGQDGKGGRVQLEFKARIYHDYFDIFNKTE